MVIGATDAFDRGPQLAAVCVICEVLVVASCIIRAWARHVGPEPVFWWDDWICFFTFPLSVVMTSLCWKAIDLGYGQHTYTLGPDERTSAGFIYTRKILWAAAAIQYIIIACIKLSALFFYARVFRNTRRFKIALWIVGAATVAWLVFSIVFSAFTCYAVGYLLPDSLRHVCVSTGPSLWVPVIPDLIIDLVILVLPMPVLWTLNTGTTNRWLLISIFAAGYSVPILSFFYLITTIETVPQFMADPMWGSVPRSNLLVTEVGVGVFIICIPNIFAFCKQAATLGWRSLFKTQTQRKQELEKNSEQASPTLSNNDHENDDDMIDFVTMLEMDRMQYSAEAAERSARKSGEDREKQAEDKPKALVESMFIRL